MIISLHIVPNSNCLNVSMTCSHYCEFKRSHSGDKEISRLARRFCDVLLGAHTVTCLVRNESINYPSTLVILQQCL
jgi:hypothetical protein